MLGPDKARFIPLCARSRLRSQLTNYMEIEFARANKTAVAPSDKATFSLRTTHARSRNMFKY